MAKKKTSPKPSAKKSISCDHPAAMIATGFGLGCSKYVPGTIGSLGAFLIVGFVYAMAPEHIFLGLLVATIITFFAGLWASEVYTNATGKKDAKEIVIDEICGQLLAVTFITYNVSGALTPQHLFVPYIVIFLLFRYFDVWKPWPCKNFEKFKGGMGIMLDDIMAAVYAVAMFYALATLMFLVLATSGVVTIK